MDTNRQPDAIELIRLADRSQSIGVHLRSTEPTLESPGIRYYDAEAVVTSGFVNGTIYLGFDSEDLSDRGRLLDAIEEAEQEADLDEPFTADWPPSGRRPTSHSLPATPTWSKSMTRPAPRSWSPYRSTWAKSG
ncbi:DUF5959 family protein [Streptomyces sp. NPDC059564]|uniref:DUF5959 family protein n=1 Tax=Streptomyces sp. NPDC059564 TaxID=3346865 RepID=UPI00367BC306